MSVPPDSLGELAPAACLTGGAAAEVAAVEAVEVELAAEGVAVDAEGFGGAGLVAAAGVEDLADETFFKLGQRLVVEDTAFDQLIDEGVELFLHGGSPWLSPTQGNSFPV